MINKITKELERHVDRTAAQLAYSINTDRHVVAKMLNLMLANGRVIKEQQPVGYYTYSLNPDYQPMHMPQEKKPSEKKPRNKPFTPNQIAGAYIAKGNVVIKLTRKASSRSVTLSGDDLDLISALYKGVKNIKGEKAVLKGVQL